MERQEWRLPPRSLPAFMHMAEHADAPPPMFDAAQAAMEPSLQAPLADMTHHFADACRLAKLRPWQMATLPHYAHDAAALNAAIDAAFGPVHPEDRAEMARALLRGIERQQPFDIAFRTLAPTRHIAFWHATARCQVDAAGTVTQLAGVCQDVTDRLHAEQAMQQTEKWTSLGQLTGGIAHDFNNLLTVISTNLEMLAETIESNHELLGFVEPARKAASSGAELTARLLAFAQRQPLRPEMVDLSVLLPSLRDLAVRTIGARYTIEVACAPDVPACMVDRAQLEGALLNLIVNARDAMPAGGRILLSAADGSAGAGDGPIPGGGGHVAVAVSDEGGGIAADIIERVCEPFFTTKPVGKGAGLGLSTVQGFARQSGGRVAVTSPPGQGACVTIHLPRAAGRPVRMMPAGESNDWLPPPLRTLVVDDTPGVLDAVLRMCARIGLRPVGAASAEQAMALLGEAQFDLLLTDVILPGRFGGPDIAREARRLQPAIGVLHMSGYTDADIVNHARLDPDIEVLIKPYGLRQLLAAVQRVTAAAALARP